LEKLDVGVLGTGYVGLVTGACLAYVGHRVVCADKDEEKVSALGEGRIPIYEPGLEDMVQRGVRRGYLSFTAELSKTVREVDVAFIAVDTPQGEDGSADLSSVAAVAREIGKALAEPRAGRVSPLVVVK